MSDDIPSWLQELPDSEETGEAKPKVKKKKKARSQSSATSNSAEFSRLQKVILIILALVLCAVCAGLSAVIYLNKGNLLGSAPQNVVAAPPVEPPPPTEEVQATPTGILTPTPTPTSILPQPSPPAEPSPTATYAVAPAFINKDKIADIIEFVEMWRELSLPGDVPIEFLTRRQLQEQWRQDAFDVATIQAIQARQEFYTALGLIEPQVDLAEAMLNSQVATVMGYYTPEEKVMYVIAESVNMFAEEEMTFAHEYVHALQDHHFDLGTIFNEDASGDMLLASRSLPEGDARAVEALFTSQNITQDQLDYNIYRYLFQEQLRFDGVSPALSIFTFFPYAAGEYFVFYLFIEGGFTWDLVNDAYSHPPVSSEQVMHPEKYRAGEIPTPITVPDLVPALGSNWREIDRDVLGEAGFLVWLIDQVEDQTAIDGAAGWDGDTYTLWVNDADQRMLAEASVWETESDAIELLEAFRDYMNLREGQTNGYEEAGVHFWKHAEGVTLLTRTGRHVLIIIAPDREILDSVRSQFVNF